jgi:hypothetical protein
MSPGVWLRANTPALIIFLACAFDLVFSADMLASQVWFIGRNQTMWEVMAHEKISYLAPFRMGCHPFDRGWCANWIEFCTMARRQTVWEISHPDSAMVLQRTQTKISALELNPSLFKQAESDG